MKLDKVSITNEQARLMLDSAKAAQQNTFPDPGGYAVTALTDTGTMYDGVAYRSETLTLTMHSEATALANAAIHGEKAVIAITGPNCHICKQLIWESALNSGKDILVVMESDDGIKFVPISEQMPFAWPDVNENR